MAVISQILIKQLYIVRLTVIKGGYLRYFSEKLMYELQSFFLHHFFEIIFKSSFLWLSFVRYFWPTFAGYTFLSLHLNSFCLYISISVNIWDKVPKSQWIIYLTLYSSISDILYVICNGRRVSWEFLIAQGFFLGDAILGFIAWETYFRLPFA